MAKELPGNYGFDAPYIPLVSIVGAGVFIVYGIAVRPSLPLMILLAVLLVMQAALYLHASKRGKFVVWRRIVEQLQLEGDEIVLDVGCALGMVALSIAPSITDGEVFAIDSWGDRDATGSAMGVAEENAVLLGVADRVEFLDGRITALPFDDGSFDVVTAHVVIQHIKDRDERRKVIEEIWRVLAPGGRLRIAETQFANQYRDDLVSIGATDAKLKNLGVEGWFGNPYYSMRLVSATKPTV